MRMKDEKQIGSAMPAGVNKKVMFCVEKFGTHPRLEALWAGFCLKQSVSIFDTLKDDDLVMLQRARPLLCVRCQTMRYQVVSNPQWITEWRRRQLPHIWLTLIDDSWVETALACEVLASTVFWPRGANTAETLRRMLRDLITQDDNESFSVDVTSYRQWSKVTGVSKSSLSRAANKIRVAESNLRPSSGFSLPPLQSLD